MFVRGINGNLNRNVLFFFLSSNFSRKNGFHSLVAVADPGEGAQGGGGGGGGGWANHFFQTKKIIQTLR